jgi:hypothetical protein
VTTVNLNSENFLNFGLWDLYLYQEPDVNHNEARIHIIAPMVGYDWYLTKSLAISGIFVQPVYGYSQSSADTGDAIGEIDFLRSDPSSARIFFLTAIYSLKRFNTEAGILCLGNACIPYLNLFWRFHGK